VREAERRKVGTMKRKVVKGWAVEQNGKFIRVVPRKWDSEFSKFYRCTVSYELPRKARKKV